MAETTTTKIPAFFAICCLVVSACGGAGGGAEVAGSATAGADSIAQARVFPSDHDVLAKVYDAAYQVPQDFFVDERANTPRSYTVYHVKDSSVSYELCTDDYDEALAWEAADNVSRSVQGEYVASYENDRYFEVIRELSFADGIGNISDPTSPGYARVFKCSYVNRDGVDRNLRDGYAGTLNTGRLSEGVIRTFTEYMWQYTFFWPARKKVLETFSVEREDSYQHTLLLAFATDQGSDRCDLIEVVDWVFTVDRNSGEITKDFNLLYQFEARPANGTPEICSN